MAKIPTLASANSRPLWQRLLLRRLKFLVVVALVLGGVVGVDRVGHVGRDQEGGCTALLVGCGGLGLVLVDMLVGVVRGVGGASRRQDRKAAENGWQQVGVGALC